MEMDGIFVYINIVNGKISGAEYQLDCAYAMSYLKKKSIKTIQYINKNISTFNCIVNDLNEYNSNYYFFYINEYNYYISLELINSLKQKKKNINVIVFGPVSEFISRTMWESIHADYFIIENSFDAFEKILSDICVDDINGIAYRNVNELIFTKKSESDIVLDEISGIYSSGLIPYEEVTNIGMLTSKGCYGNCYFCSYHTSQRFCSHSIDYIINELDYLHFMTNASKLRISFFDDCFSLSSKRTNEICDALLNKKYNMDFWCCTRADLLNEELIKKMSICNFKNIVIGMETASADLLATVGKVKVGENAEEYLKKIENCLITGRKTGLDPYLSIMLGLEGQHEKDIKETVEWLKRNKAENRVSVCYLTCFPNSRIAKKIDCSDVYKKNDVLGLPFRTYFSQFDIIKVYKYLRKNNVLYPELIENNENNFENRIKIIECFSGIYSNNELYKGIDTFLCNENVPQEWVNFIGDNIKISGNLIIRTDKIRLSSKNLYTDDRKRLKYPIKNYSVALEKFVSKGKYIPKISFVSNGNPMNFIIDEVYREKNISIKKRKFETEDLKEICEKSNIMHKEHYILLADIKKGLIKNSCRFCGNCSIAYSPRFMLQDNHLLMCMENKAELKITKKSFCISSLFKKRDDIIKQRNCNECVAKEKCSKCIALSEDISVSSYCHSVRNYRYLPEYISIVAFFYKCITNLEEYDDNDKINVFLPEYEEGVFSNCVAIEFDSNAGLLNLAENLFFPCSMFEIEYIKIGLKENFVGINSLTKEQKIFYEKLNRYGIINIIKYRG